MRLCRKHTKIKYALNIEELKCVIIKPVQLQYWYYNTVLRNGAQSHMFSYKYVR